MADSGTQQQPNYYEQLGIQPTANVQQIRRAYRDLSKLYHPDTTTLAAETATRKFQQLNEAYATLSSPERRLIYDRQIGYSRISVMQPPADLSPTAKSAQRSYSSNAYLDPTDRPLSAGEMFALFILGLTFVACLALVITVGVTQGDVVLQPDETISPPTSLREPVLESPSPPTASNSTAIREAPSLSPGLPQTPAPAMPPAPKTISRLQSASPPGPPWPHGSRRFLGIWL